MKKSKNAFVLVVIAIFALCGGLVFAESVVITGTVNDQYQLVTDSGKAYEIGENEAGEELMVQEGKKVEVKGIVTKEDEDDVEILMVTEFEIKN